MVKENVVNIPWNKGRKGLQVAWNKSTGYIIFCSFCKKEFRVIPSKKGAKYCSKSCRQYGLWQNLEYRNNFVSKVKGKKAWNRGLKGLYKCSNETRTKLSLLTKGRRLTEETKRKLSLCHKGLKLSEATRLKVSKSWFTKERVTGEKNCNWQGGKTAIRGKVRAMSLYKKWRDFIFRRDGYKCQGCEKVGGTLHADHIIGFSEILQVWKVKTIEDAISCGDLWDTNNGRTLCLRCHQKTENYLWKSKVNTTING